MKTERFTAFGWVVHRVSVNAGEVFDLENMRSTNTNRLSAQTIYTVGRITGHYIENPSVPAIERVPGFATDLLPNPLPKLHLKMQAQEDSVWWCISLPTNPSLPGVSYIRLQAGQSQSLPAGSLTFVCHGSANANGQAITGPVSVRAQNEVLLTAGNSPVYAMVFDRERVGV